MTSEQFWEEMRTKDYDELLSYLNYVIEEKIQLHNNPAIRDIYSHMRDYLRIMQLAMNLSHAKAELATDALTIITHVIATPEQKAEIATQIGNLEFLKREKLLKEIEEASRGVPP